MSILMASEATIDRELGALEAIGDSCPKYVVSMGPVAVSGNGITRLRLIGFLNDESLRRLGFAHWALVHYQFETIHPFLDGNGRIGRLLITLSLMNDGVLSGAVFYPSYQLKLRRSEYYAMLTKVRECGAYTEWVEFFCDCLLASAEDAVRAMELLVNLRNKNTSLINEEMGRSAGNGQRLLELIEGNPIVDVNFVAEQLEISRTTAVKLVKSFCDLGILAQLEANKQRYRVYLYEDYLAILRRGGDPL